MRREMNKCFVATDGCWMVGHHAHLGGCRSVLASDRHHLLYTMASILRAGLDIHEIIAQNLSPADLVAVSSTCAALRDIYRPLAFAILRWRGMIWSPPESLWGLIKYVQGLS